MAPQAPAPDRRPGPARRVLESAFRVAWADGRTAARLTMAAPGQLAPAAAPAGKEYRRANGGRAGVQRRPRTPTAEGAARVLNPRWPRRADDGRPGLPVRPPPRPGYLRDAVTALPGLAGLYAVCFRVKWRDWRTPGAARDVPRAFTMTQALLLLTRGAARGRRQLGTRHRTRPGRPGSGSVGPVSPDQAPHLNLISESPGPGCGPGAAAAAGNETGSARRSPG